MASKEPVHCPKCNQEFHDRRGLTGHMRFGHLEKEYQPQKYSEIDPDVEDAKLRIAQNHLFEENRDRKRQIYNFINPSNAK